MFVCVCKAITEDQLQETLKKGHKSLEEVSGSCGAGSDCGSCLQRLQAYLDQADAIVGDQSASATEN
ncbi:MAG: (2Fe-2S)-binding protein [Bdellovibrionaceae bacterium]|nr:(2Fe-2S)-binding protein [Pseudobdellovibrionaceae bacterium]